MSTIRRVCPAKVNLYLKVLGRRPDGYHEMVTVMQPLTLADELLVSRAAGGVSLICDHPGLPQGPENLVWRAAQLFFDALGTYPGVHLTLNKHIPVAGGLGGGSSDAAGTLLALNTLLGHPLDQGQLHGLAARLGADVPFFLGTGPAVARGVGDRLSPLKLPPYWYILANPGLTLSTRWVYENLVLAELEGREVLDPSRLDPGEPALWVHNDLETVSLKHYPEIQGLLDLLQQVGARARGMSGSGPTVFGIFADRDSAWEAAQRLKKSFTGQLWVTRGLTGGERNTAWEKEIWTV